MGQRVHDSDSPLDRLIKPGSLEHSVLWNRLANAGKGHMPPLSTEVLNSEAPDLIGSWILQDLPALESYETWHSRLIVLNVPRLTDPGGNFAGDGSINYAEYLLATDPRSATDRVRLTIERGPDTAPVSRCNGLRTRSILTAGVLWNRWVTDRSISRHLPRE